jgi:ubiquinone/menaquinone biosynthesis C-methylase UbiE
MTGPRVFLSIPVQGVRLDQAVYEAIIDALTSAGALIVNAEVNRPPDMDDLAAVSPQVVHDHNRALLDSAAAFVTEISRPSLGVGYEIAVAEERLLPILALCQTALLPQSSAMIRGIDYPGFHLQAYETPAQAGDMILAFLRRFYSGPSEDLDRSITAHFDAIAPIYDESTEWRQDATIVEWLASRVSGCRSCVDVGSGTGIVGEVARKGGATVIGVDRSFAMLRQSAQRLDGVVRGDAVALPFHSGRFEAACLRSMLHYVDDLACLKEVRRVLKRSATVVCAQATAPDVDAAAWWGALKKLTHPWRRRFYTAEMLFQRFQQNGFYVTEEVSLRIPRFERWQSVFRYSSDDSKVRRVLDRPPNAVREESRLRVSSDGIAYEQVWTLIRAEAQP